ncbi:L-rhamnose mutarotase [Aureimonas flava]|uniref:L-rhamnose mutarotase n=1 Tax=Aureimonas flava TaxID=2320271 RepID=A0A3A1WX56_9HYPH|nr:L-rhamnose mutarotase [Aureimonas flava]RIY03319.1 L-rhamnose mutarotase [Aureimonas flava]
MATAHEETVAFRMVLRPGGAAEYRRRHDAIPAELVALLREAGVRDYSIHLDPETHHLFATLKRPSDHGMDALPAHEVMRRWWASMADIMETNPDASPAVTQLEPMFRMD